ncbi:transposase [Streptomyces sp. MBT65]|nr:transposase [Streptomyces sp. MBT65]
MSGLADDTPLLELVQPAKIRWRIEHAYRELKHDLGLDHFEGRSWNGWHHHAILVTGAHAFLAKQRPAPKADAAASSSTRSSTSSRTERLDRHLHHLPPTSAQQDNTKIKKDLTESHWSSVPAGPWEVIPADLSRAAGS